MLLSVSVNKQYIFPCRGYADRRADIRRPSATQPITWGEGVGHAYSIHPSAAVQQSCQRIYFGTIVGFSELVDISPRRHTNVLDPQAIATLALCQVSRPPPALIFVSATMVAQRRFTLLSFPSH